MSEPRFAGERKPTAAKMMVMMAIRKSCTPVPTSTQNIIGIVAGGRNTSACTSFQPDSSRSSAFSSSVSTRLYLRRRARGKDEAREG